MAGAAGVFLGGTVLSGDLPQRHTTVKAVDYLLASPFEGIQLDGPIKKDTFPSEGHLWTGALGRLYGDLHSTSKRVSLKFSTDERNRRERGQHVLTIGKDKFEGEWNVTEDIVHLWIDKVNGVRVKPGQEPMEIYFRVPRVVDDPFVILAFHADPPTGKVRGVLLMRVHDDRYWKTSPGHSEQPSRTHIVLE